MQQEQEIEQTRRKRGVAVVILNYRNWRDTIECLESLSHLTHVETRIIVVDNDSRNKSLEIIQDWCRQRAQPVALLTQAESETGEGFDSGWMLIAATANRGYAAGNNIGIRAALRMGAQYVMILNNDTLVEPGFLEPLVLRLAGHPEVAMVGPLIRFPDGTIDRNCARRRPTLGDYVFRVGIGRLLDRAQHFRRRHYYMGKYDFSTPREVDVIGGSCMLLRASVLQRIGLLDEGTFLYLEEFILHEQLRAFGGKTVIVPQSRIIHKGGQSISRTSSILSVKAELASFRHYIGKYRNYPLWLLLAFRIDRFLLLWLLRRRERKGSRKAAC